MIVENFAEFCENLEIGQLFICSELDHKDYMPKWVSRRDERGITQIWPLEPEITTLFGTGNECNIRDDAVDVQIITEGEYEDFLIEEKLG